MISTLPSAVSLVLGLAEVKPRRVDRGRWPRVSSDQFAGDSQEQRTERVAGKAGQAQNWGSVREQERLLFLSRQRELGRVPLQHPKRMLLKNPERAPERVPVRKQDRQP
jgi:hypothetical protein